MSLFRPAERRTLTYQDVWGSGLEWNGSQSGESITYGTVIGLDAVAGCVGLMSDIVSMIPFHSYTDVKGVAAPLDRQPPIVTKPSPSVSAMTWKAQVVTSWMLWGNLYGLILTTDRRGHPTSIELLDPAQVICIEHPPFGTPDWFYAGKPIDPKRIMHVPGRFVRPGSILGQAPLERFRDTYGLALAARRYGAEWFRDGAHPSAILQSEQAISMEQAATIKERFMAAVRKKREPAVLGAGLTYVAAQGDPAKSQMIEVEQQVVGRIARIMGVPVEMIGGAGGGSSVTYANREQRAVDLLTYNVDPYLVRLEGMFTEALPDPQYAKATRGALQVGS